MIRLSCVLVLAKKEPPDLRLRARECGALGFPATERLGATSTVSRRSTTLFVNGS